jgi:uncharacterized membrane protein
MSFDPFGFLGPMFVLAFAVPIVTTVLIIGVIVWAIRRSVPPSEDPAVAELKARLARGDIDPSEYQARLDALQRED